MPILIIYEFYIFICCEVEYSKIISLTLGHAVASSSSVSLPFKICFNNMIKEIFLVGPMPCSAQWADDAH